MADDSSTTTRAEAAEKELAEAKLCLSGKTMSYDPAIEAKLAICIEALNTIAWREGTEVGGHFDNPADAALAREALRKIKGET